MTTSNYLTPQEEKFAHWLEESAPYLLKLWDFENGRYIRDRVDDYLTVCSTGEEAMCRFSLGVWTNGLEDYEFNLFKAMRYLGDKELKVIQDWVKDPWGC